MSFSLAFSEANFVPKQIVTMNSQASDDIKLLFIQEELSKFGEELCDALSDAIYKQKLIDSGSLLDSLNYSSFMEGKNPGQRVSFFSYGRCVDMSGYKKNKTKVNTNREVWGIRENSKKKNRWYARNMYGGLNRLIGRVMYGLSEEEIARLKGILDNRIKMNKKIGNINFVETAVGTYAIRMDSFRDSLTHLFGSAVSDWECSPTTVAGVRIVPWGADNDLPSSVRNLLEKTIWHQVFFLEKLVCYTVRGQCCIVWVSRITNASRCGLPTRKCSHGSRAGIIAVSSGNHSLNTTT